MTLSVIDPINLRYRDVIAAKKDTCEPVPNNLVTANKISLISLVYQNDACRLIEHLVIAMNADAAIPARNFLLPPIHITLY
jgi:hypothetical protein